MRHSVCWRGRGWRSVVTRSGERRTAAGWGPALRPRPRREGPTPPHHHRTRTLTTLYAPVHRTASCGCVGLRPSFFGILPRRRAERPVPAAPFPSRPAFPPTPTSPPLGARDHLWDRLCHSEPCSPAAPPPPAAQPSCPSSRVSPTAAPALAARHVRCAATGAGCRGLLASAWPRRGGLVAARGGGWAGGQGRPRSVPGRARPGKPNKPVQGPAQGQAHCPTWAIGGAGGGGPSGERGGPSSRRAPVGRPAPRRPRRVPWLPLAAGVVGFATPPHPG